MAHRPRIHITGAACAGVTTLGRALATRLDLPQADVDGFYWQPTDPPFTTKRPPAERLALIRAALGQQGWVLSGSMDGWGEELAASADLVVFVVAPTPIRLLRLRARERARYGDRINPGGDMHRIHTEFAQWAAGYDEPGFRGRNRKRHEDWLAGLNQPVLRLDGRSPTDRMVTETLAALAQAGSLPL